MSVVGRDRVARLAENQFLVAADRDTRDTVLHYSRRAKDFLVEAADAGRRAGLDEKFDVGNAERHVAEFFFRRVAAEVVAPRAGGGDVAVVARPFELRADEALLDRLEPLLQVLGVGDHETHVAGEALPAARRQMELLLADVGPHVVEADREIRVAREAETDDIEKNRLRLVGDRDVQMLQQNDVADVFFAVRPLLAHNILVEFALRQAQDERIFFLLLFSFMLSLSKHYFNSYGT